MPENTIDNNLNTRWSNSALGSWIKYDIGGENMICHLDVAWFKGNQRSYNLIISASSDGTTFTDIYTGVSAKSTTLQRYDIQDTKARYRKIIINGNNANSWAEVTEVDIYGYASDMIAPSVEITRPANASSAYTGRIVVEGTASDNAGGSGVQSVEVRVDNGTSTQLTPIAPNDWSYWTAAMDIVGEGDHVIYAKAIDIASNSDEASVAILVITDSGSPIVQISAPGNSSMVNIIDGTPVSVNGSASDTESGIKAVQIELDNSGIYYPTSSTSGAWASWTGTLSIETSGTHVITARATDNAGNIAYGSLTINTSATNTWLDKFGIKKIYPTKDGKEWYVAMEDPRSDPYFRNLQNLQLTLQSDGSWQAEAQNCQVRMEAWSQENN
ncbi:MAG TPA: Ig-like domain-containing protein [Nitrososphaera sp.]|nr:Ig-like domain-containing protein [Nitrososphaera sp.]